jgi:SAM-dependent methyltransferase
VLQKIPVLVRKWETLESQLTEARQIKPGWYINEQLPESKSPWRHHLKKRREYVETSIKKYLATHDRQRAISLLDLGCGDGNNLEYLQKYSDTVLGSDYNIVRLIRGQEKFPDVVLFLADILDYPVQDNFFEIIFFNHVLEHIHDDERALQTVHRILKPNGLLVLGVPNEGAWWWQLAYKLEPNTKKNTDHVHFYTADAIKSKLLDQGFEILETRHMGWGPPHWGLDYIIRRFKIVDDIFEFLGKRIIPTQASSLYILATKKP